MALNPVVLCVLLPIAILGAVTLLGFGPGGIAAGSIAAKMMSFLGTKDIVVPTLQSIGAVGLSHPLLWIPTVIIIGLCLCVCPLLM